MTPKRGAALWQQRTALYRFFGRDGSLIYVGITANVSQRFRQHRRDHAATWWPLISDHTVTWMKDRHEASAAEIEAIKNERPLYNVVHGYRSPRNSNARFLGEETLALARQHFGDRPFTRAELFPFSSISRAGHEKHIQALRDAGRLIPVGYRSNARRQGKRHVLYAVAGSPSTKFAEPIWELARANDEDPLRIVDGKLPPKPPGPPRAPTRHRIELLRQVRERLGEEPFTRADLEAAIGFSRTGVRKFVAQMIKAQHLVVVGARRQGNKQGHDPLLYSIAEIPHDGHRAAL